MQQAFGDNPNGAIVHFLKHGKAEGRLYARAQLFFADPPCQPAVQPALQTETPQRVAVLVPLHPVAAWEEICALMQNFDGEAIDLFVGIREQEWTPELHARLRQDYPGIRILILQNQEQEMQNYLALMRQVVWQNYDIFCLVHADKQAAQNTRNTIVGSKANVQRNLAMLRGDRMIGLIAMRENEKNRLASSLLVKRQVLQPIYDRFHAIADTVSESENNHENDRFLNPSVNNVSEQMLTRLIHYLTHAQGLQIDWQESP